jgi:hypothetical protein
MNKFVEFYNWPTLPEDIIDDVRKMVEKERPNLKSLSEKFDHFYIPENLNITPVISESYDNELALHPSELNLMYKNTLCDFNVYFGPDSLVQWTEKNLSEYIPKNLRAVAMVLEFRNGSSYIPHTDISRHGAVNYVVEDGNATTCLYEALDDYKDKKVTAGAMFPYHRLNVVEEHQFPREVWHRLDTNKIHSVEHIQGTRLVITLSLNEK